MIRNGWSDEWSFVYCRIFSILLLLAFAIDVKAEGHLDISSYLGTKLNSSKTT